MARCKNCDDTGHVCENHPDKPWGPLTFDVDACACGAGMPCPTCCRTDVPQDGTHSILECFTPDDRKPPPRLCKPIRRLKPIRLTR